MTMPFFGHFITYDCLKFYAAILELRRMTMECYVQNKTTDVPLSVINNCMPNALHRGKLFDVKI